LKQHHNLALEQWGVGSHRRQPALVNYNNPLPRVCSIRAPCLKKFQSWDNLSQAGAWIWKRENEKVVKRTTSRRAKAESLYRAVSNQAAFAIS